MMIKINLIIWIIRLINYTNNNKILATSSREVGEKSAWSTDITIITNNIAKIYVIIDKLVAK